MQKTVQHQVSAQEGVRLFMLRVYNYMAAALVFTGLISYATSNSPEAMGLIFGTPLRYVILFAPIGLAFLMGMRLHALSLSTLQVLYWVYAALIGLSLSALFLMYTGDSIASVFFITASIFVATSVYGYVTKKDLSAFGSFLFMGLVGIVIASLVNMFMQNSAIATMISFIAVFVFAGLTAYDNQRLRTMYSEAWDEEAKEKIAIMGALTLYLDFVNLFIHLLRLLGDRRQ
jgi:FtsH-binding integral membrane protein